MKKYLLSLILLVLTAWAFGQYCSPIYTTGCTSGDQINNFSTSLGITNISNLNSGCSTGAYSYHTATQVTVSPSGTFNFTVQSGPSWDQGFRIWVDWKKDNDFTDPGEDMWNSGTSATTPFNGSITAPNGAVGTFRMRVRCVYSAVPTDPCTSETWGEVEDYNIVINAPYKDDAGVIAISSPSSPTCSFGNLPINITLANSGSDTLKSATINYTVNGSPQTPVNWTGVVMPYSSLSGVFVANYTFTANDVLKVWSSSPNGVNDSLPGNDTSLVTLIPGMSGTYTIGGTTPNYPTFNAAVSDLNAYGLCGPVIFNVRAGSYNEQISLGAINGSSATNTITFNGVDKDSVMLWDGSNNFTSNYVIDLNGASYITFQNLKIRNTSSTYKYVVNFSGASNNITFNNNYLYNDSSVAYITTSTNSSIVYSSNGSNSDSLKFTNNIMIGGSYAFYMYGSGTTSLAKNLVIEANTIKSYYYGMRLYYQDAPKVRNNIIDMSLSGYTGTMYGIYPWYCDNAFEVTGNVINLSRPNGTTYGIYAANNDGSGSQRALISNNMIITGDTNSTSTNYGIYCSSCGFQDIYNNSINVLSNSTFARGIYLASGGAINVVNNNVSGFNGDNIYVTTGFTINEANHNNLYNKNGSVGYDGSQSHTTLAAWQSATGNDMNSVSVDPQFYAQDNLHTCAQALDGAGKTISLITMDIDGDMRNTSTPDIGADEFAALVGSFLGPDTSICAGDSITIGVLVPGTYLWVPSGDTTGTITVGPGNYQLLASTVCGSGNDNIVIGTLPSATASFTAAPSFLTYTFTNTSTNANSYYWDFGDGNNSTLTNPVHVYASAGTYTTTLIAYGDCGNDTTTMQVTPNTVGLDEYNFTNGVVVSPNPNNGQFAVSLTLADNESVKMEVIDIAGKVVHTENVSGKEGQNTVNVNLANAKGVYFVKLTSKLGTAIERVVIN